MGRKKETLYLAYGSNMNQAQMAYRCPTAEVVGTSELKGYELLFRGAHRGAVATVEPKEGSAVPVLLWKIRKSDEEALDSYEGYPRLYGKQMLQVELDGKEVSAMGYSRRESTHACPGACRCGQIRGRLWDILRRSIPRSCRTGQRRCICT